MAINKSLKQSGYFIDATTDGLKVIQEITKDLKTRVDSYGAEVLEKVCQIFVERAKLKLATCGYKTRSFLDNIYYQKYGENKYRVGIKNNNDKPIMYFLEFGTGIVGLNNSHPEASEIGWEYIVNPDNLASNSYGYNSEVFPTGYNSLDEDVGLEGWYYRDPATGRLEFTSGLKAVSYIYDTLQEMDDIIKQAKREVKF